MKSSEPALQGKLLSFSIQDVMSFLSQVRASGALHVEATEGQISMYWESGLLTWSSSSVGELSTADLLIQRGVVDAERVAMLQDEGHEGELGSALLEAGHVESTELDRILAERVGETVYRIFLWQPTRFRFEDDGEPPTGVHKVALDAQGVLLEGARRCDEWERLPEIFRDPRTTFDLMAEPKSDDMVSLSIDEWRHLYLVNGYRSLAAIWEASPVASELEISAILYGLASARLIRAEIPREEEVEEFAELPEKTPVAPAPVEMAQVGLETLSLDALRAREREARKKELEENTTKSMPPSSIRRLSLSEVEIRSSGRLVSLLRNLPKASYLLDGGASVLGRSPDCEIVLPDGHVSARHAQISRDGHHFLLEDLGSANGVVVGEKETRRTFLRGGEIIEIYPYRFQFELEFDVSEG